MKHSKIIACGSALPGKCVPNNALPEHLDTSDEWIKSRTGITQRYITDENTLTSDLAAQAAKRALANAGLETVDAIIVATTTPDRTFPATAATVQAKLGIKSGFAFDVQAVCGGFVFAMATADNFIKSGQIKTALVIGAETLTKILDWQDRATCVLFGDGAGAVVLQVSEKPGILGSCLHTDGSLEEHLYVDGGVGSTQTAGLLRMQGKEVFKHAVPKMADATLEVLEAANLSLADVDWVVPHQANKRIIDAIAKRLEVEECKIVETVSKHANTSAASIPLAICDNWENFKPGQLIVLTALGAGFSWGAVALRF